MKTTECPTCNGTGQVHLMFGTCPVAPTIATKLAIEIVNKTWFNSNEMETIRHLLILATQHTQAIYEFGYDEAESTEENQRMWNLHFQAAIKEISDKPSSMADEEWKAFLKKLS